MALLDEKAKEVVDELVLPKTVALDPATILLILQVIAGIIQMLYYCNQTSEKAAAFAQRPGLWGRYRLRRYLQRKLWDNKDLYKNLRSIESTLEQMGKEATPTELEELHIEVLAMGRVDCEKPE
jgi:hypothetical protein